MFSALALVDCESKPEGTGIRARGRARPSADRVTSTAVEVPARSYPLTELRPRGSTASNAFSDGSEAAPPSYATREDEQVADADAESQSHRYEVYRSFQLLKTSMLPLIGGQRLLLMPMGGTAHTASPSYHSSSLVWCAGMYMPPSFSMHLGALVPRKKDSASQRAPAIGKVQYKGICGMIGLHFVVKIYAARDDGVEGEGELLKRFDVRRNGIWRTYKMGRKQRGGAAGAAAARVEGHGAPFEDGLVWRGMSMKRLNKLDVNNPDTHDHKLSNSVWLGHLELVRASQPDKTLAIFSNDFEWGFKNHYHMGDFFLFENLDEGSGMEEVLLAGLGIVAAERMSKRST